MTVKELIEILKTQPQDIQVCYMFRSDYSLLQSEELEIKKLCFPRTDNYIENNRPDKPTQDYLVLPGN